MEVETNKVLTAKSPGKLNLTFDIIGDLPDGYHEVETLMQAIDLEDELTFTLSPSPSFDVEICSIEYAGVSGNMPSDKSNLIARAVTLFHDEHLGTASDYKVSIAVRKSVPIAGGMGGGSGNAAAALLAMNAFFDNALSSEELIKLSAQLGADVPFFLRGGTQIGRHRGDVLTPVENTAVLHFLIVSPKSLALQTPGIYSAYDKFIGNEEMSKQIIHPNTRSCADALLKGDVIAASQNFGNVFEPVVFSQLEELKFLRNRLESVGGLCTHLTGSGPTLYMTLPSQQDAEHIMSAIEEEQAKRNETAWQKYPNLNVNCWTAQSVQHGAHLLMSAPP
jgi:4-diphosphocytidyl-2-C-methyl-D-erythritol kinase